jgi:hypothetical protein
MMAPNGKMEEMEGDGNGELGSHTYWTSAWTSFTIPVFMKIYRGMNRR